MKSARSPGFFIELHKIIGGSGEIAEHLVKCVHHFGNDRLCAKVATSAVSGDGFGDHVCCEVAIFVAYSGNCSTAHTLGYNADVPALRLTESLLNFCNASDAVEVVHSGIIYRELLLSYKEHEHISSGCSVAGIFRDLSFELEVYRNRRESDDPTKRNHGKRESLCFFYISWHNYFLSVKHSSNKTPFYDNTVLYIITHSRKNFYT